MFDYSIVNTLKCALEAYKKAKLHTSVITIYTNELNDLPAAFQYADEVDLPEIWSTYSFVYTTRLIGDTVAIL
jgi:hypothetical protein